MNPFWVMLVLLACAAPAAPEEDMPASVYVTAESRAAAQERLDRLSPELREAADAALAPLKALPPGLSSVQAARELYVQGRLRSTKTAKKYDKSPATTAFEAMALVILSDLIARTGPLVAAAPDAEAQAVALLRAVNALDVVADGGIYWLGEELAQALPQPLYVHATQVVGPAKKAAPAGGF